MSYGYFRSLKAKLCARFDLIILRSYSRRVSRAVVVATIVAVCESERVAQMFYVCSGSCRHSTSNGTAFVATIVAVCESECVAQMFYV